MRTNQQTGLPIIEAARQELERDGITGQDALLILNKLSVSCDEDDYFDAVASACGVLVAAKVRRLWASHNPHYGTAGR